MNSFLIRAARLLDGNGGPALTDQDVLVRQGRIAEIGPAGTLAAGDAEVVVVSGSLLPGLINAHVHLRHDGVHFEEPPDQQILTAFANCRRLLTHGVTTARDTGGFGSLTQAVRDAVASGLMLGPRIVSCGVGITSTAGHGWVRWLRADSADDLRRACRRLVEQGVDAIKIAATGGSMPPGSNPHSAQYSAREIAVLVEDAHRLGRRVAAHAEATEGIVNCVVAGVDTIEHCGWLGPDHGLLVDDRTLDLMRVQRTTVVPTLCEWFRTGWENLEALGSAERTSRGKLPFLGPYDEAPAGRRARAAVWGEMHRSGIRFAAGTDTWDPIQRELELMVGLMGVTTAEAIVIATRNGARALGLGDEVGTIEVGKVADLLAVAGDPLTEVAALRRVDRVWKSGTLVVERGMVKG
ncbi:MAG: amidohydrolase family protein [Chloroflexi bacterium]|nr:amidohydrolase family protein [Chloroflexota bacterium]